MAKDFRNKKFQKVLRGYADTEVDAYIAYMNDEYHKLERAKSDGERKLALTLQKIDEMNGTIEEQNRKLTELNGIEPEFAMRQVEEERNRLAEETANKRAQAEEMLRSAEEKLAQAEQIRAEAVRNAEQILASAQAEADAAKAEGEAASAHARSLYGEVCSFRDALFEIYNTHIESVEEIAGQAEAFLGAVDGNAAESDESAESEESEESGCGEPDELPETGAAEAESDDSGISEPECGGESDGDAGEEEPDPDFIPPEPQRTEDGDLFIDLEDDGFTELTEDYAELTDEEESGDDLSGENVDVVDGDKPAEISDADEAELPEPEALPADGDELSVLLGERKDEAAGDDDFAKRPDDVELSIYRLGELIRQNRGSAEKEKNIDFVDLDDLFSKGNGSATDDEFSRVYGGDSTKRVDEIRRQPTVVPEEPKNPKKHKKF